MFQEKEARRSDFDKDSARFSAFLRSRNLGLHLKHKVNISYMLNSSRNFRLHAYMKTEIHKFLLGIEHIHSDIRGPKYLPLKKVYFFCGSPGRFRHKGEGVQTKVLIHLVDVFDISLSAGSGHGVMTITSPCPLNQSWKHPIINSPS